MIFYKFPLSAYTHNEKTSPDSGNSQEPSIDNGNPIRSFVLPKKMPLLQTKWFRGSPDDYGNQGTTIAIIDTTSDQKNFTEDEIKHEWSIGPRTISFSEVLGGHQMEGGLPVIPLFWNIWDLEVYTTCKQPFFFRYAWNRDIIIRTLYDSNPDLCCAPSSTFPESIALRSFDR